MSAIVDFGLYVLLLEVVGLPVNVAKSISFIAGTTTAYLINRRWTFKAEPSRARFVAVVVLYAVTFAVQVGLNWVMYHAFPDEWCVCRSRSSSPRARRRSSISSCSAR